MPDYETIDLSVCSDCIMAISNGDLGDVSEEYEAEYDAAVKSHWTTTEGWEVVPGNEDLGFSWRQCEGCGSNLGGDRFEAHAMKLRDEENN